MFFLTFSSLWAFSYFFYITYITFIISLLMYILPIMGTNMKYSTSNRRTVSDIVNGWDLLYTNLVPYITLILINMLWVSPSISVWFGHLIITSLQVKITYLVIFFFISSLVIHFSTTYFNSREPYDYTITLFSFAYWLLVIFYANSIFTSIFIIEVLSALIFLLLVTSTFSTTFFYRNLNFSFGSYFQLSTPFTYLQSVIFFFWMSLLASLNLFLFLILFYTKLSTMDWFLSEFIFNYFIQTSSYQSLASFCIIWFIMLFSVFIKCGIAPLYIWKPTFFKGLPFYTLFFYICFFYFFIFLFFIILISVYLGELFYYFILVNIIILFSGLVLLLAVLCESYYIKSFMAMSSILNSLFVLTALVSEHTISLFFWL